MYPSRKKLQGRCPRCEEWNTFEVMKVSLRDQIKVKGKSSKEKIKRNNHLELEKPIHYQDVKVEEETRINIKEKELDQLFGGGLVRGSSYLIYGEPGIGKSTLLLEIAGNLEENIKVLYICGEETNKQVKERIDRLVFKNIRLYLLNQTEVRAIRNIIEQEKFDIILLDSLQTLYSKEIGAYPGAIMQIKFATQELIECTKSYQITLIITGHVIKVGDVAGPKLVEHMVDGTF